MVKEMIEKASSKKKIYGIFGTNLSNTHEKVKHILENSEYKKNGLVYSQREGTISFKKTGSVIYILSTVFKDRDPDGLQFYGYWFDGIFFLDKESENSRYGKIVKFRDKGKEFKNG